MGRSFLSIAAILIAVATGAGGCAPTNPAPPGTPVLPVMTVRTATMNITPGVEVLARVALPDGFTPAPDYPPMWLQAGKEVAVAGTRGGHAVVMGYGGTAYRTERVIAEDGGIGAPDGSVVDLAASPNGMDLALAVVNREDKRLDVVVRDVISDGAAQPVSNFDGEFEGVSLGWMGNFTIPLALRARTVDPSVKDSDEDAAKPVATLASSGLYTIAINGVVTADYLKLKCEMSRLSWSPQGNLAVGAGDLRVPAILINRDKQSCERINAKAPIRVLDWSHDSKAFLYQETNSAIGPGTYRFDIAKNGARLVAVASGAAVFIGSGDVLALGNAELNFRKIQNGPDAQCSAELAVSNPSGSETDLKSLGFGTTPAMLAASRMIYSRETDAAAIATFSPTPGGPQREIVIYSVAPQRAFLVAFGPVRGGLVMSWSPRGRYLALVDGDVTASALTIMAPPR